MGRNANENSSLRLNHISGVYSPLAGRSYGAAQVYQQNHDGSVGGGNQNYFMFKFSSEYAYNAYNLLIGTKTAPVKLCGMMEGAPCLTYLYWNLDGSIHPRNSMYGEEGLLEADGAETSPPANGWKNPHGMGDPTLKVRPPSPLCRAVNVKLSGDFRLLVMNSG